MDVRQFLLEPSLRRLHFQVFVEDHRDIARTIVALGRSSFYAEITGASRDIARTSQDLLAILRDIAGAFEAWQFYGADPCGRIEEEIMQQELGRELDIVLRERDRSPSTD